MSTSPVRRRPTARRRVAAALVAATVAATALAATSVQAQQVYVSARDVAAPAASQNLFGRFDLLTGVYTPIAVVADFYFALTAGNDGMLYGSTMSAQVHRIDPLTGIGTALGASGPFLTGLAQHGAALLGKDNTATSALHTVSTVDGSLSNARGSLGTADQSDNLERAGNGTLYYLGALAADPNSVALYTVDASTGGATLVGSTTPYRDVRALSAVGTALYGFGACPAGTPAGRNCVLEIDATTGAITGTARTTGFQVIAAAGALAAPTLPATTVPEPATVTLVAVGLLAVAGRARRRR